MIGKIYGLSQRKVLRYVQDVYTPISCIPWQIKNVKNKMICYMDDILAGFWYEHK